MQIDQDIKLDFKDVLIKPKRSTLRSRSDVSIERTYTFKHSGDKWTGVPIIAANMDTVGTFEMALALAPHQLSVAFHKHYNLGELSNFFEHSVRKSEFKPRIFNSIGITEDDLIKYDSLCDILDKKRIVSSKKVCIDVANGYSEPFLDFVKRFRDDHPYTTIMAGNVVTAEMTEALILAGADIVKVGIGPGSACTTRVKTGVGYPQLSAVIECADAAHGLGGHICSDGGCNVPGDVAKAFGGGADFVMLGGMLAGHDESGGELVKKHYVTHQTSADGGKMLETKEFKTFYGMSSTEAMEKYSGGVAGYRASEGKSVLIPYRGPVENTVLDILGGLRSALTYTGSLKLKELPKRTTFIRVTQQENTVYGKE